MSWEMSPTCLGATPSLSGTVFLNLVNTIIASQCALDPRKLYPENYTAKLKNEDAFDYIIVGAGSAGSVVASRLSEHESVSVLLIEAGDYPSVETEIPALFFDIQNTKEDWAYRTESSDTCCQGLKDKRCRWPRGKVLGGSSAINGMLYLRGSRRDYDGWASMGLKGWDYNSVQKFFYKSEGTTSYKHKKLPNHNTKGLLGTSLYKPEHPFVQKMIEGAKELGYNYNEAEGTLGYTHVLTTIENGTRCSSSKAFLGKINKRENLKIALGVQVAKVILNGTKASGVEVKIGGQMLRLKAREEVILSAGSINSPQILMNSGIGPKERLESLGINVVKDLKVGENLQDHLFFSGQIFALPDSLVKKSSGIDEAFKFFAHRSGIFSTVDILNVVAMMNTKNDSIYSDMQHHFFLINKGDFHQAQSWSNGLGYEESTSNSLLELVKEKNILLVCSSLSTPKSKGSVLLRSSNPFDQPLIYPNYLSDENNEDLDTMLRSIWYTKKLFTETKALEKYKIEPVRLHIENCKDIKDEKDYFICALRNIGTTTYHPTGTCKMGNDSDPSAVVDSKLRVRGIRKLRIIDASVMPEITGVNTNAPTIMIGEKGAEMIKSTFPRQTRHKFLSMFASI